MRARALLPVVTLAAFATVAASCLSPTLPLPPPDLPENIGQATMPGLWEISGTCVKGATVFVLDVNTGRGVFVEDKANLGLYQVTLPGNACDEATVSQASSTDAEDGSTSTTFVLEAFAGGMPTDPSACP